MQTHTEQLQQSLMQYLATKPWAEVNNFIQVLGSSKTVEEYLKASGQEAVRIQRPEPDGSNGQSEEQQSEPEANDQSEEPVPN